jgi:hypothetical protein
MTKEQCKENAILYTLSYLNVNWRNVYGIDMVRTDICGEVVAVPLPPPTGLNVVCDATGKKATVSWNAVSGADYYALRVDDVSSSGFTCGTAPGDFCQDVYATSYTFDVTPGKQYGWWVHVIKSGVWSDPTSGDLFTCVSPPITCVPAWRCEIHLTGFEEDGCGNRRANPACNPLQTGDINFVSTPAGAEIFIYGADQGVKTPNTATNVPAGDLAYVLKLAGYNDYSGTVSVIAGQTANVSVTLTPSTPSCVPAWKCEIHLTGFEEDGCGNRRANPACVYREAVLASCQWPLEAIAGQAAKVTITVNQGSLIENYKLVFSGDIAGESTPFIVDAGASQQQFTIGNLILTTGGTKNVSATLIKV